MSRSSVQRSRSTVILGQVLHFWRSGRNGTKRCLGYDGVRASDSKYTFSVLLRVSSVYVNVGAFGPVATPEAIVVKREDVFLEALDEDCDKLVGLEMG